MRVYAAQGSAACNAADEPCSSACYASYRVTTSAVKGTIASPAGSNPDRTDENTTPALTRMSVPVCSGGTKITSLRVATSPAYQHVATLKDQPLELFNAPS